MREVLLNLPNPPAYSPGSTLPPTFSSSQIHPYQSFNQDDPAQLQEDLRGSWRIPHETDFKLFSIYTQLTRLEKVGGEV